MPYCEIENGKVVATFNRPQPGSAEVFYADDDPLVIDFRDGLNGPVMLSALEFFDLFTQSEQLAVLAAEKGDPTVELFFRKLAVAGNVELDHPEVTAGLDALVVAGLITEARKGEILSGTAPAA